MNGHNPDGTESDPNKKDAYDEFEERMRRIGNLIVTQWKELRLDQKVSHSIAVAGIAILIVYTVYTVKISNATHESLVRSQRPWLGKETVVQFAINIVNTNMVMGDLVFTVKNFGPSPALYVGVGAIPFIRHKGDTSEFTEARDNACQWADTNAIVIGDSHFPQEVKQYDAAVLSPVDGVEKSRMILAAGCIAYRDQFDTTHATHHTTFCVMGEIANLKSLYNCGVGEIAD